jgi:tetratricopeptide (TPR) repeat protein
LAILADSIGGSDPVARFENLEMGPDPSDRDKQRPAPAGYVPPEHDDERGALKLADQFRRRGQYENALRQYSRALELDKSLVAGWIGQVQMLVQLGEAPEAELWSRKALEIFPGNGDLLAGRAQAFARIGDIKRAGDASDGALAAAGKSAYRWTVRGEWMLAAQHKLEEHAFNKAEQLDRDWLVPLETALIYLHYRFASRAIARARAAAEAAPDQYYAWYVRGCAEADAGMKRPANESFQHCLQLCPGHVEAKERLRKLSSDGLAPVRWIRNLFIR